MGVRLAQSIYMALGAAGAMVDVTSYCDLRAGFDRSWGRDSEFDDTKPGEFSFTLDNADGRFTPGNTVAASAAGYATTLSEGMVVCHQLGGSRLVRGTVQAIEPVFPGGESAWAQVRITCDDMLGDAARHEIPDLNEIAAGAYAFWPLSDAAGSTSAAGEPVGTPGLTAGSGVQFGNTASGIPTGESVALLFEANSTLMVDSQLGAFPYPSNTYGAWGYWVHSNGLNVRLYVTYPAPVTGQLSSLVLQVAGSTTRTATAYIEANGGIPALVQLERSGDPFYISGAVSVSVTGGLATYTVSLWVNGVLVGADSYASGVALHSTKVPASVTLGPYGVIGSGATAVARLSHSPVPLAEGVNAPGTEADRIASIGGVVPEIILDALPAGLSTAPLGSGGVSGSALDALNDVIRTEQGYVDTVTTGSLSAPVEKVRVRERTRPETVTASFNAETEADGTTDFIRDLTNLARSVTADGPTQSVTYSAPALEARAGSSTVKEQVLNRDLADLFAYATDRSFRGANEVLRCASLTIDALNTPTDRSADLLALKPGDRIRVTGLPSTQLGFSSWDGWLLGVDEAHTIDEHSFTLHLAPTLPDTGIFDDADARYMADGVLSLSAGINASTTSVSVATAGATFTTAGGDLPLYIIVDSEVMQVTACSGATPQVMTVVRGQLGTTAATHSSGALVELYTPALYAF